MGVERRINEIEGGSCSFAGAGVAGGGVRRRRRGIQEVEGVDWGFAFGWEGLVVPGSGVEAVGAGRRINEIEGGNCNFADAGVAGGGVRRRWRAIQEVQGADFSFAFGWEGSAVPGSGVEAVGAGQRINEIEEGGCSFAGAGVAGGGVRRRWRGINEIEEVDFSFVLGRECCVLCGRWVEAAGVERRINKMGAGLYTLWSAAAAGLAGVR